VLQRALDRIDANNAAIDRGGTGEFGRRVEVRLIEHEVPLHYLTNFNADRFRTAVELGVRVARDWCRDNGVTLGPPRPRTPVPDDPTSLRFTEEMNGYFAFGETDFERGAERGRARDQKLGFRLTIHVDGIDRFIANPDHVARAEGEVRSDALGGRQRVERGTFNLLVDDSHPGGQRMLYRLFSHDLAGRPITLSGVKFVRDDPGPDLWRDTTALYTRILDGHVDEKEEDGAAVVGAGILTLGKLDLVRQLTTFRVRAPSRAERLKALTRFGRLFFGRLWDVYARRILWPGPV
jgi:hypothetical protein